MYVAFSLSICMYIYQDKFIRRWYYGGHTDVYIPYGENLHYYDANSLYPFAMLWDMREGNPKWVSNERIDDEKDFILPSIWDMPDQAIPQPMTGSSQAGTKLRQLI